MGSGEDEDEEGSTELARLFACGGESGEDERGALENEEEEGGFFLLGWKEKGQGTRMQKEEGERERLLVRVTLVPTHVPSSSRTLGCIPSGCCSCVDRRDISLL